MNDKWVSDNLTYEQTIELFKTTFQESVRIFSNIYEYFSNISTKFNKFSEEPASKAPKSTSDIPRPGAFAARVQRSMTTIGSVSTNQLQQQFPHNESTSFESAHICQIQAFRSAAMSLKNEYIPYLMRVRQDYMKKMIEVSEKANGALKSLEESKAHRESAYKKYCQQGEKLKEAYDQNDSSLAALKDAFLSAQKNAVDTHTHMNEVTAQTAMKMESAITEFEDIEKWRSEQLKDIMKKFSEWLGIFGGDVKKGNVSFDQLLQLIPQDEEIDRIMDTSDVTSPAVDIDYQIVPLNLLFSKFLPKDEIFREEVKNGGKLYRVIKQCDSHGEFLDAVPGEIIVGLETRDDNLFAKDINECEGLVPLSAVELDN